MAEARQASSAAAAEGQCSLEQSRQLATTIFKRTATGGHGFVLLWGWVRQNMMNAEALLTLALF